MSNGYNPSFIVIEFLNPKSSYYFHGFTVYVCACVYYILLLCFNSKMQKMWSYFHVSNNTCVFELEISDKLFYEGEGYLPCHMLISFLSVNIQTLLYHLDCQFLLTSVGQLFKNIFK